MIDGETRVVGEERGMFCKSVVGCTFCSIGGEGMLEEFGLVTGPEILREGLVCTSDRTVLMV